MSEKNIKNRLNLEVKLSEKNAEVRSLKSRLDAALAVIRRNEKEMKTLLALKKGSAQNGKIIRATKGLSSEAVAFVVASDWHIEEKIKPGSVNNLNEFNSCIATKRAKTFFVNTVKLLKIFKRDIRINTVVLALLGDFISGNIHEEIVEVAEEQPMHAILKAQSLLMSGIDYLLEKTRFNFIVVCKVGNHSRITPETRHATETGNSLEYPMYRTLALHYASNKRIRFVVEDSYHTYLKVFDKVVRFHHGHGIRYAGGVGGLTIPLNKAIAQWNKARRADLDVLGHWHSFKDYGNAIVNGSLIGYAPYSIAIKADFEQPKQAFFLLDKKRGKTVVAPIVVNWKWRTPN
jgi:hypothetical protein